MSNIKLVTNWTTIKPTRTPVHEINSRSLSCSQAWRTKNTWFENYVIRLFGLSAIVYNNLNKHVFSFVFQTVHKASIDNATQRTLLFIPTRIELWSLEFLLSLFFFQFLSMCQVTKRKIRFTDISRFLFDSSSNYENNQTCYKAWTNLSKPETDQSQCWKEKRCSNDEEWGSWYEILDSPVRPFNTSTSIKREKAEEFGRLGILRNRRSSTVKVDKVNTRENRWFARPSNERIARVPVASYSTVVLARNPEFNASLMSVPFSFGSAAIVANSPPFLPTHPFPYDPSIDESDRSKAIDSDRIRVPVDDRILVSFFFLLYFYLLSFSSSSLSLIWIGIWCIRFTLLASFVFMVFFLFSLIFLPVDRESRVVVGETASNNFPLIIIVREGGANLCALARTGCVQVENQRASTIACII